MFWPLITRKSNGSSNFATWFFIKGMCVLQKHSLRSTCFYCQYRLGYQSCLLIFTNLNPIVIHCSNVMTPRVIKQN